MFQKGVVNRRAVLQIVDGFEKRDDRQGALQAFGGLSHQADLSGKQVDHEQIRDVSGHAHDQASEPVETISRTEFLENPQGGQDRIGFGPERYIGPCKGPLGFELTMQ